MSDAARQAAAALQRRTARVRMERAEVAERTRSRVVALVRERLPERARAWLIGSLAWGEFGTRSDIDLVVDGMADDEALLLELALVEDLRLPVDLLRYQDLPLGLKERVDQEGLPIHGG
jgi:predicted nucleotidyltransferase